MKQLAEPCVRINAFKILFRIYVEILENSGLESQEHRGRGLLTK